MCLHPRTCLLSALIIKEVYADLLSDEHFSVDGTLIEAWASQKSFQRQGSGEKLPPDDVDTELLEANGTAERDAGLLMAERIEGAKRVTVAADKGYTKEFVREMRDNERHAARCAERQRRGVAPEIPAYSGSVPSGKVKYSCHWTPRGTSTHFWLAPER